MMKLTNHDIAKYQRQIQLTEVGNEGQQKLKKARIAVVGAGGLGAPLLLYLAAAGVGHLTIIDGDHVSLTNLHRQILFGESDIGKNKAEAAREKLLLAHSGLKINAIDSYLSLENFELLFEKIDLVVDATDNFPSRYLINDWAIGMNKPVVIGAIDQYEGQVTVYNYSEPSSYRCLFPNIPETDKIMNCSEQGVLGITPGIVGLQMANEVLKMILGIGQVLQNKLWVFNCLTLENKVFNYHSNTKSIEIAKENFRQKKSMGNLPCSASIPTTNSLSSWLNQENVILVDVRNLDEQPRITSSNLMEIPLSKLPNKLSSLEKFNFIITICQTGYRSEKAAETILKNFPNKEVYSLKNGLNEI